MEMFKEAYKNWAKWNSTLYLECEKYLKETLSNIPEHSIDLSDTDDQLTVAYDGDNHPEYASNCYSCVNSVYLKNDNIYVDIEDSYDYNIHRLNAEELYDIAYLVYQLLNE